MTSNKRQRTEDTVSTHVVAMSPPSSRIPKLRLCTKLASKLGARYCSKEELVALMLRNPSICSKMRVNTISKATGGQLEIVRREQLCLGVVLLAYFDYEESIYADDAVELLLSKGAVVSVSTFEIKATRMGDLNGDWTIITLDDEHATAADVKEGMERAKGIRPAMQELFRYDESWTGTKASGGSGHTEEQEDAALLEEGYVFEGPCSVVVSVNELYDVVLEGQEEGDPQQGLMGVYQCIEGKEVNGRGMWQKMGREIFLFFNDSNEWAVADREDMESGVAGFMLVKSTATNPECIVEPWQVADISTRSAADAPKLRVRVCGSVEKHAAVERMEQEDEKALELAAEMKHVLVEGQGEGEAQHEKMGVYELLEGKSVNRRGVWQLSAKVSGRIQ
jgi:hypothetical protein